ncbi:MAG: SUMF1/EgtB/PvdO family nonheme iron enzyme [Phycisphaeraceae bacterium]|nr:SUMF1/EgtB/PvdO family nonheme iron enzyme [Phycisphaeraceae bacterium]
MSFRQSKPVVCALFAAVALSGAAFSQGVHNNQYLQFTQAHGMTFSTIGDVGNPSYNFRGPFNINYSIGAVDYEYRIATTETTASQYAQFVDVYRHFVPADERQTLAGRSLDYLGMSGGVPTYALDPGWENRPAFASFRYFARMANWLHHGAPDLANATHETFTTGAYNDTVIGPRASGAQVWIPSWDEWVKAAYWDPNRNGQGEGGYWLYPDASDTPLTPGDPGLGGETNAGSGAEWPADHFQPWDVGSYPDVQTPWGLLDASGGGREWTDSQAFAPLDGRYVMSSGRRPTPLTPGDPLFVDDIEFFFFDRDINSFYVTVRFAAAIPSPGALGLGAIAALVSLRRSR